jgi:hypothetical protein
MTPKSPAAHLTADATLAASFEIGVAAPARVLCKIEENTPQIFRKSEKLYLP